MPLLLSLLLLQPLFSLLASLLLGLFCKGKLVRRITSHRNWLYSALTHTDPQITWVKEGSRAVKIFSRNPAVEGEPVPVKGFPDNSSTWTTDAVDVRQQRTGTI